MRSTRSERAVRDDAATTHTSHHRRARRRPPRDRILRSKPPTTHAQALHRDVIAVGWRYSAEMWFGVISELSDEGVILCTKGRTGDPFEVRFVS